MGHAVNLLTDKVVVSLDPEIKVVRISTVSMLDIKYENFSRTQETLARSLLKARPLTRVFPVLLWWVSSTLQNANTAAEILSQLKKTDTCFFFTPARHTALYSRYLVHCLLKLSQPVRHFFSSFKLETCALGALRTSSKKSTCVFLSVSVWPFRFIPWRVVVSCPCDLK